MAPLSCTKSSINHIMDVSGCSIPQRTLALFDVLMRRQQEQTDPFPFATIVRSCAKKPKATTMDGHVGWQRLVHVHCMHIVSNSNQIQTQVCKQKLHHVWREKYNITQCHPQPAVSLTDRSTLGRPHKFWLLRRALGQPFFPLPPRPRRLREKVLQGGASQTPSLIRHNHHGFPCWAKNNKKHIH